MIIIESIDLAMRFRQSVAKYPASEQILAEQLGESSELITAGSEANPDQLHAGGVVGPAVPVAPHRGQQVVPGTNKI